MASRLVNRNVVAERGRTSMRLEPELWDALAEICLREGHDLNRLVRQIEIAREECYCPVEVSLIPGVGHAPQRERPDLALDAIAGFANRILTLHHEGEPA